MSGWPISYELSEKRRALEKKKKGRHVKDAAASASVVQLPVQCSGPCNSYTSADAYTRLRETSSRYRNRLSQIPV